MITKHHDKKGYSLGWLTNSFLINMINICLSTKLIVLFCPIQRSSTIGILTSFGKNAYLLIATSKLAEINGIQKPGLHLWHRHMFYVATTFIYSKRWHFVVAQLFLGHPVVFWRSYEIIFLLIWVTVCFKKVVKNKKSHTRIVLCLNLKQH